MSLKGKASSPSPAPVLKNATAAPVIYFDGAPVYGIYGGNIEIELSLHILMPSRDGVTVLSDMLCVGHLRCPPAAMKLLVEAGAKAIAMIEQKPDGEAVN